MRELYRRLRANPVIAAELAVASLFANLLALASPLFVIQVLNRYVTYGIDATLVTLTVGVVAAVILEFAFRQARLMLAGGELGESDSQRAEGAFGLLVTAKRAALDRVPGGKRREILRGLDTVATAYGPANIAAVLDVPFALLFLLALALLSPTLGLIALMFIAGVFLFGVMNQHLLRGPTRDLTEAGAHGNALAVAADRGADTVRAFHGTELIMGVWRTHVERLLDLRRHVGGSQGQAQTIAQTAQALMGVAVIAIGATQVVAGNLDVGMLIGANLLAARALGPVNRLAQLGETMAKAEQALADVEDLAKLPVERDKGAALTDYAGGLEFRDVAFSHPGASGPLFESLSLVLAPGAVLAVSGRNGTGKTTLARMMVALIDPTRGQVLADGVDLRQTVPAWWRRQVVYVPQEPVFLPGSIRDNLLAADPDLSDESLDALLRRAGLGRFIDESPQGTETRLDDGGASLAPGVRRRLALARALATDGRLAVLDEPTEGLDEEGRAAVYAAMKDLSERGRTIVVFTHDPVLLRGARQVLDLNAKPKPQLLTVNVGGKARPETAS